MERFCLLTVEAAQVPDDAGTVAAAADDDVVAVTGRQTRDRLGVSVQRHLQVQTALVAALAVLPHVHHLQAQHVVHDFRICTHIHWCYITWNGYIQVLVGVRTVLVPAVMTILALGQAAQSSSPLSKPSNTHVACRHEQQSCQNSERHLHS